MLSKFNRIFKASSSQNHENQDLKPSKPVIGPHFFKPGEGKVTITVNRNIPVLETPDDLCAHAPSFSNAYLNKINAITEMKDDRKSESSVKSRSIKSESSCQKKEEMSEIFEYSFSDSKYSSSASTDSCSKPALPIVQSRDHSVAKVQDWLRKNEKWERKHEFKKSEKSKKSGFKKVKLS